MGKSNDKKTSNENSVNVALRELMGLEDERQYEEDELKKRLEEEMEARRIEEERQRQLEEEQQRRREEEAHLAREKSLREEKEEKEREARERELMVKSRVEAEARVTEQARLFEYELEMKRIAASDRKAPAWFWPVAAVLVLGLFGAGGAVYVAVTSDADNRVEAAQRDLMDARERSEERLASLRSQADTAQQERDRVKKELDRLTRTNSELQEQNRRLQIASKGKPKGKPYRGGRVTPRPDSKPDNDPFKSIIGCDNPAGCGGELDDLPLSTKKKKKNR